MKMVMVTQRLVRLPFAFLKGFPSSGWFVKKVVYLGAEGTDRGEGICVEPGRAGDITRAPTMSHVRPQEMMALRAGRLERAA